jgi:hypothetical protein
MEIIREALTIPSHLLLPQLSQEEEKTKEEEKKSMNACP